MAMIKDLQVQCEKDMMRVRIQFDRPFYGMVFSKGHYSNINCVHVPSGLGQTQVYLNCDLFFKKKCDHSHVFKKKCDRGHVYILSLKMPKMPNMVNLTSF